MTFEEYVACLQPYLENIDWYVVPLVILSVIFTIGFWSRGFTISDLKHHIANLRVELAQAQSQFPPPPPVQPAPIPVEVSLIKEYSNIVEHIIDNGNYREIDMADEIRAVNEGLGQLLAKYGIATKETPHA